MGKIKIMVVEDEGITAEDIKMSLEELGYAIPAVVATGEEALKKAEEHMPDLVLMDIMLQGKMNGIEAAGLIRSRFNIPVVYLTAHTDEKTLEMTKVTEPFGYIIKPFEDRELHTIIEMALYKHKAEETVSQNYYIQSVVNSVLRTALDPISLKEQLERILDILLSVSWLKIQSRGAIYLADENSKELVMIAQRGFSISQQDKYAKVTFGMCLCGQAVSTRKIVFSDHVDDRHENRYEGILPHGHYCIPILSGNRELGVINLYVKEGHRRDKREEEFLLAIADTLAGIIERKRMEEELIKTQKLESIGILAGGIAHDFNNLLTIIMGNISLAKMDANPEDGIYGRLVNAENASLRTKDLTQQLLTFSRGGMPVKKIASIIELIINITNLALSGSNVRCKFDMAEDIWPVEVDKGQINQVINNLIINADQAMPAGGIIEVKAENVNVGKEDVLTLKEGRYVKTTIKDQGIGISQEYLQKIFDPYFTTKEKGSGLGLTTTYSIVKKHDGYITVESEIGVGTAFHIYLPASRSEIPKENDIEEIPLSGKGRILVMDDKELIRKLAGDMLGTLGYEAEFAVDGEEAIELYKNARDGGNTFDAVILDLTIPGGMGGREAVKKLIEIDPDVKAIVSSGYSNDPVMANYREYGFIGVIPKPFEIREVSEILYKLLTDKSR